MDQAKSLSQVRSTALLSTLQVVFGSLFIALCAQIAFPLPFTPIPITLQTVGIMLVGLTLGKEKGFLSVMFYLIQGSLGAPVWAGGAVDCLRILGPAGGYLLAAPLQAYLIGKWTQNRSSVFLPLALASALQLSIGSLWLSQFTGLKNCLLLGFVPFIATELFKILLVTPFARKNHD